MFIFSDGRVKLQTTLITYRINTWKIFYITVHIIIIIIITGVLQRPRREEKTKINTHRNGLTMARKYVLSHVLG